MSMSKCAGGPPNAPVAPWMFALAGRQHSEKLEHIRTLNFIMHSDMQPK